MYDASVKKHSLNINMPCPSVEEQGKNPLIMEIHISQLQI